MKDFSEHCVEFSEALSALADAERVSAPDECAKTLRVIATVAQQQARRIAPAGTREGDVEALHNAALETLLELYAVEVVPASAASGLIKLFRHMADFLEKHKPEDSGSLPN